MLAHTDFNEIVFWHMKKETIAGIYVIIWWIYYPFIELGKGEINIQQLMLALQKESTASQKINSK